MRDFHHFRIFSETILVPDVGTAPSLACYHSSVKLFPFARYDAPALARHGWMLF
jgi:hypothetical protein